MNIELIEDALHEYFSTHHYRVNEKLNLNLFYPIKEFQKDKFEKYIYYHFCESLVTVVPSLEVSSIVVAPRESANV